MSIKKKAPVTSTWRATPCRRSRGTCTRRGRYEWYRWAHRVSENAVATRALEKVASALAFFWPMCFHWTRRKRKFRFLPSASALARMFATLGLESGGLARGGSCASGPPVRPLVARRERRGRCTARLLTGQEHRERPVMTARTDLHPGSIYNSSIVARWLVTYRCPS